MENLVISATSEELTAEDWSIIIRICEIAEGSKDKGREIIQILKNRLLHKNINVILYSLTLSNALVQNCSLAVRQEIASRPFLSNFKKILTNSKSHSIVKSRILDLIQTWAESFRNEHSLDYMNEFYREILSSGEFVFPSQLPPSPVKTFKMSAKEIEEEELQLALAMSLSQQAPNNGNQSSPATNTLFQAKALYDFIPNESGELKLVKGDIINVIDNSSFTDWWKGTLNGKVGIFPSNYVTSLLHQTSNPNNIKTTGLNEELASQLKSIQQLKTMILNADPLGHDRNEIDRIQKEYNSVISLVPAVLTNANEQRRKQEELTAFQEKLFNSTATFQGIMNSYAQHRNQSQNQNFNQQFNSYGH